MKSTVCQNRTLGFGMLVAVIIGGASHAQDLGWPRQYGDAQSQVILYQPQIRSWENHEVMNLVAALEVKTAGQDKPVYGVLEAQAKTQTNVGARTVLLYNLQPTALRFPELPPDKAPGYTALVTSLLPSTKGKSTEVSLDRVTAYLEQSPAEQRLVEVSLDPPTIFYSAEPAILVLFMGKPNFKKVGDTGLLAGVNTNWDVFLDPAQSRFYLLDGDAWLTTADPKNGPWEPARNLPPGLSKLPADQNWEEIRKHIPGATIEKSPKVFISPNPAELIITDGEPNFSLIPGTKLMDVTNTESILFMHMAENQYYFQVAGRWFRAASLAGPWSTASNNLPEDFTLIPDDHEKAFVKATVPGTLDAQDAVLLASVPQKTSVKRGEAKCDVTYDGAPQFQTIEATAVQYAVNTPNDVFVVQNVFYCCYQGMWFTSASANGPWVLCTTVPQDLYTIPANHPKHNVTYVYVYDSTPDIVQVGYTSGYSGEYVAATGVVMFGLGMVAGALLADDDWDDWHDWDDDDWDNHYYYRYPPTYYSYGCGAVYDYRYGGYYRGAVAYGPYGGAGRAAYYNPSTGAWARGGSRYGPAGSASAVQGYNPFTDTYAARAGVQTDYGSAGRFYAERGNEAVWGGHRSTEQGGIAWAQTDDGGRGVHTNTDRGQSTAVKTEGGDVYVGHDGNVYKNDGGSWYKREDGDWNQANVPQQESQPQYQQKGTQTTSSRTQPSTAPTTTEAQRPAQRPAQPSTTETQRPAQRPAQPTTTEAQRPAQRPAQPSTTETQRPAQRPAQPSTTQTQRPTRTSASPGTRPSGGSSQQLNRDAQSRSRGNYNTQRSSTQRPSASRPSGGSRSGGSRGGGGRGR
jgi:hypothetical protein